MRAGAHRMAWSGSSITRSRSAIARSERCLNAMLGPSPDTVTAYGLTAADVRGWLSWLAVSSTGLRGSARVVLRGACTGTMADLLGRSTCVDTEGELMPVSTAKLGRDMTTPPSSERVGTFGATEPCTA